MAEQVNLCLLLTQVQPLPLAEVPSPSSSRGSAGHTWGRASQARPRGTPRLPPVAPKEAARRSALRLTVTPSPIPPAAGNRRPSEPRAGEPDRLENAPPSARRERILLRGGCSHSGSCHPERGQRKQDVLAPAAGKENRAGSGLVAPQRPLYWRPPSTGCAKPIVSAVFLQSLEPAGLDAVVGSASTLHTLEGLSH